MTRMALVVVAGSARGVALAPRREYVHALASRALTGRSRHPEALQELAA